MSFPDCLRKILLDRILNPVDARGSVTLREKGVMTMELSGLGADTVTIRVGKMGFSGIKDGRGRSAATT